MILINGVETRHVDAQDRGLQYGDGLFETIAITKNKPIFWDRHYRRLARGCERLNMACADQGLLLSEMMLVSEMQQQCVVKITLTRGVARGAGDRGYRFNANKADSSTRIVARYPWHVYPSDNTQSGIKMRLCQLRLGINPQLAGIKHLNRLEQVLARNEWADNHISEGLLLDHSGNVIEGTMSNLFIVKNSVLLTPDLSGCGVEGIMREVIIDIAKTNSIPVEISNIKLTEVYDADEVFVCNSLFKLWPVRQLEHRKYHYGPVAQQIVSYLD